LNGAGRGPISGLIPPRYKELVMTTERLVRIFAGAFVLVSLALGVEASPLFHSHNWLWFTAFVGANLFQSGFTCFCPLETILRKLGVRSAAE
jgi:hypothetical protein